MRYILLLLTCAVFVAGCKNTGATNSTSPAIAVGSGLGAAEAYRSMALKGADSPSVVRSALGDDAQKKSLAQAQQALTNLEAIVAADHDTIVRLTSELQAERSQWIGDRAWRWIWIFVGSYVALGILSSYLSFASGGTSVLAGFLIKLLPLANLFPKK